LNWLFGWLWVVLRGKKEVFCNLLWRRVEGYATMWQGDKLAKWLIYKDF